MDVSSSAARRSVLERSSTTTDTTTDRRPGDESHKGVADEDGQGDSAGLSGRAPEETAVQLLDGARDAQATGAAEDALTAFGCEVVAGEATADRWDETAAYHTPGWQEEASDRVERDERFAIGRENPGLLVDVALHVIVGADLTD